MVSEYGINTDFIQVDNGFSRINMKIKNIDGTEINGMGPQISEDNLHSLVSKIDRLSSGDVLVLAGSIPSCISDDIYRRIMGRLQGRDVKIIVDATSRLLLNVLEYHPFLIKPNQHELGDIFGVKLESKEEVIPYARKLQDMGAVNVLISMGGKGAVLIDEHGNVYEADAPKGELKNSVGAGDSMVAGFMAGYLQTGNYEDAFRMGVATGSASAFSENLATKREISEVLKRVEVTCKR
ncbi:MAG: 1-phosphofructokinase family hexose kinase [Lachnospira eligens]